MNLSKLDGMINLLMVVTFVAALVITVWPVVTRKEMPRFSKGVFFMLVLFVFLLLVRMTAFYSEAGFFYHVQYPFGGKVDMITDPGYSIRPFAKITQWPQYITIDLSNDEESTSDTPSDKNTSITDVRFRDAVAADISITVRVGIPTDFENFMEMHKRYRTPKNLIEGTLIPFINQAVRNGMRLLSAQEYISGLGGKFEFSFGDQLAGGIYRLDEEAALKESQAKPASVETVDFDVEDANLIELKEKKDEKGNIERDISTSLVAKGFVVDQAVISRIVFEPKFLERIDKQKEASTEAAQAALEVKKLVQKTLQAEEEARMNIAIEKGVYEREQIKVVTEAETRKKEAAINQEIARVNLETARIASEQEVVAAEASATARRALAESDNNLKIKLDSMERQTKMIADALGKNPIVPSVVISGTGEGGSAANALDVISAAMAKHLADTAMRVDVDLDVKND